MRKVVAGLGALLAASAAAGLAGCGSSGGGNGSANGIASESPSQILSAATAALKTAKSVHIQGSLTKSGKKESLDLTLYASGDVSGSLTQGSVTLGITKVGSTDYIKASTAYYTSQGLPAAVAGEMGGRWVSLPDSQGGFGDEFSLKSFAAQVKNKAGKLTAGTTSTVDGQAVVSVHSSKGNTVYVATSGKPYPVKVVGTSPSEGTGSFTFTAWNTSSAPSAPAGAKPASSFGQ